MGEWFALPLIEQALAQGDPGDPDDEIFHPIAERVLARCDACPAHRRPVGGRGPDGRHGAAARQDRLHVDSRSPVTEPRRSRKSEMMIVAAARALEGQRVCFVGVGLPEHRGQPRPADRRARPRAGLRGGRLRGAAAAAAAEHRRPDDRHRLDRGRQHARAVRLLPAGRADRRRVPGRRPDRSVRQHQHDRHRPVRRTRRRGCPAPAARARSRSTPARCS